MTLRLIFMLCLLPTWMNAQCTMGADLSYANKVEAEGGIYRSFDGRLVDPYVYFAERGAEMVRIRLWHRPENIEGFCDGPITSGGMADVLLAARRTTEAGMQLNLAIHYSDYFVDPGKQRRPAAWAGLNTETVADSIYAYTTRVLNALAAQETLPAILAVGNETDNGFVDRSAPTDGFSWPADATKFNAGLRAVRDFNTTNGTTVKSAIHLTERYARFGAAEFAENGVTDYDVLGLSYYPHFDPQTSVADIGGLVRHLVTTYEKEVMIFETGFSWTTTGFADNYNNFLNGIGNVNPYPASPAGQRDFLVDLATTVLDNGGTGVLYWEPAWVTSDMCDQWGRGSSYENASFFNFDNGNAALPAFEFLTVCATVSDREPALLGELAVYPNPYREGLLRVESPVLLTEWSLLSVDGRRVAGEKWKNPGRTPFLQLEDRPEGLYFLRFTTVGGRVVTRRLMLQHE